MQRFNTITKLIATPALVIALSAGAAMAGPLQHIGGNAHKKIQIGQSEMSRNVVGQTADAPTTKISPLTDRIDGEGGITITIMDIPTFDFDSQNFLNVWDIDPRRIALCKQFGC